MFRLWLCLALAPFACLSTGCGEIEKWQNEQKEKEKKAKEESKTTEKPKPKPLEFAGLPTTDPAILAASNNRKVLAEREEEVLQKFEAIRKNLENGKNQSNKKDVTVKEFLGLAKEVRQSVVLASDALVGLTESTNALARELRHAPMAYSLAAESFRSRANDYSEPRLHNQLLAFADDYEQIASALPERAIGLKRFQGELPKMGEKLRQAKTYLDDLTLFLEAHPGVGTTDPRERYSGEFSLFVNSFSELIRTLDSFKDILRSGAVSLKIQEEYRKELKERLTEIAKAKREMDPLIEKSLDWVENQFHEPKPPLVENQREPKLEETPSSSHIDSQPLLHQRTWQPNTNGPNNKSTHRGVFLISREPQRKRPCCLRVCRFLLLRCHR